jgi:hypothetical protein
MATRLLPSSSLIRAAEGESHRIERALGGLRARKRELESRLEELSLEIASLLDRQRLLAQLTQGEEAVGASEVPPGRLVKGRQLRREAGHLLWTTLGDGQIHYREWYERMLATGVAVGGKDPLASFLTNVRDSPAVAKGSRPGYYRLDRNSVAIVRQTRSEALAELADVTARLEQARRPGGSTSADELRSHRDRMVHRIRVLEADLAEVEAIFSAASNREAA